MKFKNSILCVALITISTLQYARDTLLVNGCTIKIVRGDITQLSSKVGALVNAANKELSRGGGVCGSIFQAAEGNTKELRTYIKENFSGGIAIGQAIITPSFNLKNNSDFIIHAVGPDCRIESQKSNWKKLLEDAYRNSLDLASKNEITSLAFPFISSAIYQCPKIEGAHIAITTIINYIKDTRDTSITTIYFVLFDDKDYSIFENILNHGSNLVGEPTL